MIRLAAAAAAVAVVAAAAASDAAARGRPARACLREIGPHRAEDLVRECREVALSAPASCRASDPCAALRDAIERGCEKAGRTAPAFCAGYVPPPSEDEDDE